MSETDLRYHPQREARIAVGPDSSVYRDGKFVIKQYPTLNYDTLLKYQRFTNQVAQSLYENPDVGTVSIQGNPWRVHFSVAPILEVSEDVPHQTKSAYVAGPNAFSMLERSKRASLGIDELNEEERHFMLRLLGLLENRGFWHEFSASTNTDGLIDRIRQETQVENLRSIARVNTKLRANVDQRELQIVITDLGNNISSLVFS